MKSVLDSFFFFCTQKSSCFSTIFRSVYLVHHVAFAPLSKTGCLHLFGSISGPSVLFRWPLCVFSHQPHSLDSCSFLVKALRPGPANPATLLFPFRLVLRESILCLLELYLQLPSFLILGKILGSHPYSLLFFSYGEPFPCHHILLLKTSVFRQVNWTL